MDLGVEALELDQLLMVTRTEIKLGTGKHQMVIRCQEVREQVAAEALDGQLLWELKSFTMMKESEAGAKVSRDLGVGVG